MRQLQADNMKTEQLFFCQADVMASSGKGTASFSVLSNAIGTVLANKRKYTSNRMHQSHFFSPENPGNCSSIRTKKPGDLLTEILNISFG